MLFRYFCGIRILVLIIGLWILVILFIGGSLVGLFIVRVLFLVVFILYIIVGVVVIRFKLYLCFKCFWMIFMCSMLRKLIWNLKFSVVEFFGL